MAVVRVKDSRTQEVWEVMEAMEALPQWFWEVVRLQLQHRVQAQTRVEILAAFFAKDRGVHVP